MNRRERTFDDRKPIGDDANCEKCDAPVEGGGTRPVDNVALIVCEDHADWGREHVLTGGEVIVRPKTDAEGGD